ncbi:MAG: hypothetical protein K6T83_03675 [Alicyclobacillus sp.]|nr:hypothetical protein [Alicyclobacillus sp.]
MAKRKVRMKRRHGEQVSGHTIKRAKPVSISLEQERQRKAFKLSNRRQKRFAK